jgi:hypothetical protein
MVVDAIHVRALKPLQTERLVHIEITETHRIHTTRVRHHPRRKPN